MTADKTPAPAPDTAASTSEQEELLIKAMQESVKLEPVKLDTIITEEPEFTKSSFSSPVPKLTLDGLKAIVDPIIEKRKEHDEKVLRYLGNEGSTILTKEQQELLLSMVKKMPENYPFGPKAGDMAGFIERPSDAPQRNILRERERELFRGRSLPLFRDDELELLYQHYNRSVGAKTITAPLGSLQRSLWFKFTNPYNLSQAIDELVPYIQRRQYQDWVWFTRTHNFDQTLKDHRETLEEPRRYEESRLFTEKVLYTKSDFISSAAKRDGLVPEITIELVDQSTDSTDPSSESQPSAPDEPTDPSSESPEE